MRVLIITGNVVTNRILHPDDKPLLPGMVAAGDYPSAGIGSAVVDGVPQPLPSNPVSQETLAAAVRQERDNRIEAVGWRLERNASESRLGQETTDDIAALDSYVQALRDLPDQAGFPWDGPDTAPWPVEP